MREFCVCSRRHRIPVTFQPCHINLITVAADGSRSTASFLGSVSFAISKHNSIYNETQPDPFLRRHHSILYLHRRQWPGQCLSCSTDIVTTLPTVPSGSYPDVDAVALAKFTHDGDVLIELKGPSNMTDAANHLISAPHAAT